MVREERRFIDGEAGRIELAIDVPPSTPKLLGGFALIAHPHPLYGGSLDNKVAATIARCFSSLGWLAVRLNFRGVGASEGAHDEGRGETLDFLRVIDAIPGLAGLGERLVAAPRRVLAGFSFGSFVAARAAEVLIERGSPADRLVLVGAAAGKWPLPAVARGSLVIHGEFDETIPLADVLDWARPQDQPVVVLPGADHFFHRRLALLKTLISEHIAGMSAIDAGAQSLQSRPE